jgi:hypothetical protein
MRTLSAERIELIDAKSLCRNLNNNSYGLGDAAERRTVPIDLKL